MPWIWLIAGPNGSGKSTLAKGLRNAIGPPMGLAYRNAISSLAAKANWVNPDEILVDMLSHEKENQDRSLNRIMLEAARAADEQLVRCIDEGVSVVRETVLSTDRLKPVVDSALKKGFQLGLIFVALASPEDSVERVRLRVILGGHDVPTERIRLRWARSIENLPWFADRADPVLVYDNSALASPVLLYEKNTAIWTAHRPGRIPEIDAAIAPCLRVRRLP